MDEQAVLDLKQAAAYLGVSMAYMRALTREHKLPHTRQPIREGAQVSKIVFTLVDLETFRTRDSAHYGPRVDQRRRCIVHLRDDEYLQLQNYLHEQMPEVVLQRARDTLSLRKESHGRKD